MTIHLTICKIRRAPLEYVPHTVFPRLKMDSPKKKLWDKTNKIKKDHGVGLHTFFPATHPIDCMQKSLDRTFILIGLGILIQAQYPRNVRR